MTDKNSFLRESGYELTYRDSGNTIVRKYEIHFSFLRMQFFTPTQKITIPKYKFIFPIHRSENNSFLLLPLMISKSLFIFFTVLLLLHVHFNYLAIGFFSPILIGVSFSSDLFQFYMFLIY